ncbi:MAG: hypothetical protein ACYCZF_11765 [Anaerolineae bacterium]
MGVRRRIRQVGTVHIVGTIAAALGLLFTIAFGAKVLEAYRLRNWRQRLQVEVHQLEREQAEWQFEVQRRQSSAWVEEELGSIGWVRDDQVRVVAVAVTPIATSIVGSEPTPAQSVPLDPMGDSTLFGNTNWQAWRRLIGGFD